MRPQTKENSMSNKFLGALILIVLLAVAGFVASKSGMMDGNPVLEAMKEK